MSLDLIGPSSDHSTSKFPEIFLIILPYLH